MIILYKEVHHRTYIHFITFPEMIRFNQHHVRVRDVN